MPEIEKNICYNFILFIEFERNSETNQICIDSIQINEIQNRIINVLSSL